MVSKKDLCIIVVGDLLNWIVTFASRAILVEVSV